MKKIGPFLLSLGLCFSFPTYGQYSATGLGETGTSSEDQVAELLTNLGWYLGFDIVDQKSTTERELLNSTLSLVKAGQPLLTALFATFPVNADFPNFSDNKNYDFLNVNTDNTISLLPNFANPSSESGSTDVTVTEGVDQKEYRKDPVSQSILNILGTPDVSVCSNEKDTKCANINQNTVMSNELLDITNADGYLPGDAVYFSNDLNAGIIDQLHTDTLLAPLIYSTSASTTSGKSLPTAQQAMSFIRYASGMVVPIDTMTKIDYDQLYDNQKTSASAKKDLMTYLLKLRVYAAQNSVPISNLAYMMEKRMPQTPKTSDVTTTSTTSEAFNEYVMATWRLFSPGAKEQWISQIDKASSATVQKEIAILLAEMSYQMYLTRRDQERLLLTESMVLLQTMSSNKPNTNVNSITTETESATN